MIATSQFRACDVCRLCDYDCSEKICTYCNLCDAWICRDDINKWGRRLYAASIRKLEFGYRGLHNYQEIATRGVDNVSDTRPDNNVSSPE